MHLKTLSLVFFCSGLLACSGSGGEPYDAGPDIDASPISVKSIVRFKGNDRLRNEFARVLELPKDEVCKELGLYSCTHLAHAISLGGVDPYFSGLLEPLGETSATTPMAVERVALSACLKRAEIDFGTDTAAVLFVDLPITADGKLSSLEDPAVNALLLNLYRRAFQRNPAPHEIAALKLLYTQIAENDTEAPARQWAVLSCFAVMTTMEQLFY